MTVKKCITFESMFYLVGMKTWNRLKCCSENDQRSVRIHRLTFMPNIAWTSVSSGCTAQCKSDGCTTSPVFTGQITGCHYGAASVLSGTLVERRPGIDGNRRSSPPIAHRAALGRCIPRRPCSYRTSVPPLHGWQVGAAHAGGVAALHSTCSRRSTRLPRLRGTSRTSGAVAASLCPWQRHSCCGHWWRGGRRRFFSTTSSTDDGACSTPPSDPSDRLLSCSAGRTRARQAQELVLAVHLLLVASQSPSDLGSGSSTE